MHFKILNMGCIVQDLSSSARLISLSIMPFKLIYIVEKIKVFLCFKAKCNFFVYITFIIYLLIGTNIIPLYIKDFCYRYFSIQVDLKAIVMHIFYSL